MGYHPSAQLWHFAVLDDFIGGGVFRTLALSSLVETPYLISRRTFASSVKESAQMDFPWKWEPSEDCPCIKFNFELCPREEVPVCDVYWNNLKLYLADVMSQLAKTLCVEDLGAYVVNVFDRKLVITTVPIPGVLLPLVLMRMNSLFANGETFVSEGLLEETKQLREKISQLERKLDVFKNTAEQKKHYSLRRLEQLEKTLELFNSPWDGPHARALEEKKKLQEEMEADKILDAQTVCLLEEEIKSARSLEKSNSLSCAFVMDLSRATDRLEGPAPEKCVRFRKKAEPGSGLEGPEEVDTPWQDDEERSSAWNRLRFYNSRLPTNASVPGYWRSYLSHLHILATLLRPSFPGGGVNDPFNISDGTFLRKLEIDEILTGTHASRKDFSAAVGEAIRYLNRYLVFVAAGKGSYGVKKTRPGDCCSYLELKEWASIKQEFQELVEMQVNFAEPAQDAAPSEETSPKNKRAMSNKATTVKLLEAWRKSDVRNKVSQLYFRPWPSNIPGEDMFILMPDNNGLTGYNLYLGYKYSLSKLASDFVACDKKILKEFWKLIYNNLAGGDDAVFMYLIKYLAHVVQFPYCRTNTAVVLSGGQGIGKTVLITAIGEVLGDMFFKENAGQADTRFNSMYSNRILLLMDEHDICTDYNRLKTVITDETLNVEKKFQEVMILENFTNLVIAKNGTMLFKEEGTGLDGDDRRFFVSSCCDHLSPQLSQRTREVCGQMAADPEMKVAHGFFFQLLNIDLSDFDPRDYPVTKKCKVNRQANRDNYVPVWFYRRLLEGTLLPCPTTDFLASQSEFANPSTFLGNSNENNDALFSDSNIFNPLSFTGAQLHQWKTFYQRNNFKYLNQYEWSYICHVHKTCTVPNLSQDIKLVKMTHEELQTYWRNPLWLQAVPTHKLYVDFKSFCSRNLSKNAPVNFNTFVSHFQRCIPFGQKISAELEISGSTLRGTEMMFFPPYKEVREYFEKNFRDLVRDEDSMFIQKSEWTDPPPIPFYFSDPSKDMRLLFSKAGLTSQRKKAWFNHVLKDVDKDGYISPPKHDIFDLWRPVQLDFSAAVTSEIAERRTFKKTRLDAEAHIRRIVELESTVERSAKLNDELYESLRRLEDELKQSKQEIMRLNEELQKAQRNDVDKFLELAIEAPIVVQPGGVFE